MNMLSSLKSSFLDTIATVFSLKKEDLSHVILELNVDENKQQFGDLSCNAAMVLAKQLQKNPRELAQQIVDATSNPLIDRVEIAGPGFLNIFLTPQALQQLLYELTTQKENFFHLDKTVPKKHVNIEFVSANPTGPLHLGHGRGGIIGDVLGNILNFIGHRASKEFYINDAGAQIQKLGRSLKARCQQESGMEIGLPEDGYAGEYLIDLAKECVKEYGTAVIGEPDSFFSKYAQEHLLAAIKTTLQTYGITFNTWFSEKSLHTDGSIDRTLQELKNKGNLYEKDGALWFCATKFGDDKDRVMRKSTGELTYVAADAAYLENKAKRGFDTLIMILGHDHHGYVQRLQGLKEALGLDQVRLDAILYQLVKMKSAGAQVRMSKRAGNIVTLSDVIDTVGTDVARFFYLNRKADAQLEFDLALALKKTEENPVYYLQYAYVRTKSILEKARQAGLPLPTPEDSAHCNASEAIIIRKAASLQELLAAIATNYQTHLLTYYSLSLAQLFHKYYAKNRIIDTENKARSAGRLLVTQTVNNTLATLMDLLGISKPESM